MIVLWMLFILAFVATFGFNYWLFFLDDNKFPGTEARLGHGLLAVAMVFFTSFLFLSALISIWLHWFPAMLLGMLASPILGYPTIMGIGALVDFVMRRKK